MKCIIIGNSTAAIGCIEGIRSVSDKANITVISNEPHTSYSRPLISYLLAGKTTLEKMRVRPADFYEKNKVTLICPATAQSIDSEKKIVTLSDGKTVPYDKLLIATGARPFIPPIAGLDKISFHTFLTLDDALNLQKVVLPNSRVLIIGAGLIGVKCAEGLWGSVGSITIVDVADRVLPSVLDQTAADMVRAHIESKGIEVILNNAVSKVEEGKAHLKDGSILPFDILVVASGVAPNTQLAVAEGCTVGRGIITDTHQRTCLPNIYAAGDCTDSLDVASGIQKNLAVLPNAYMQGETAGINMAGGDKIFDKATALNALSLFGLHTMTAGVYSGQEHTHTNGESYKKLFTENGHLVGFILVSDVDRAGIYTSLIRNRTPLDTIDFDLIFEKPSLMAFSKKVRTEQLGFDGRNAT